MITNGKIHALTAAQKQAYADGGYVLVEGVFTPEEAAFLRKEAHDLAHRLADVHDDGLRNQGWGSGAKVTDLPRELLHCHNVQYHSAAFSRLITDPRLTDRAADIIGPNVMLHHTKMFIKPPERGAPFPMHQDVPYFPFAKHSMIAAIIHFDDAPLAKGCVRVVPGSHKAGLLEHLTDGGHHLPPETYPVSEATPCPARAGDVLFFSYLTIHGSGLNTSQEARTTLLVQMRDPADRPARISHLSRGQGMMLRGVDPTADSGTSVPSPSRHLTAARPRRPGRTTTLGKSPARRSASRSQSRRTHDGILAKPRGDPAEWVLGAETLRIRIDDLTAQIRQVRAGDRRAYGRIVARFQGMALGDATSQLGDAHLAADAGPVDLAQLRQAAAVPGWFRRIGHKHCDRIRRRQRLHLLPLDEEQWEAQDRHRLLAAAIQRLPETERAAGRRHPGWRRRPRR